MSTIEQIEERVARVERTQSDHELLIKRIADTQEMLAPLVAQHDRTQAMHKDAILLHQKIMAALGEIQEEQGARQAEHEARMAEHEVRMQKLDEGLEETRRFNRQTRRLYVLIARKANWLDEDEIAEWENDDD